MIMFIAVEASPDNAMLSSISLANLSSITLHFHAVDDVRAMTMGDGGCGTFRHVGRSPVSRCVAST